MTTCGGWRHHRDTVRSERTLTHKRTEGVWCHQSTQFGCIRPECPGLGLAGPGGQHSTVSLQFRNGFSHWRMTKYCCVRNTSSPSQVLSWEEGGKCLRQAAAAEKPRAELRAGAGSLSRLARAEYEGSNTPRSKLGLDKPTLSARWFP